MKFELTCTSDVLLDAYPELKNDERVEITNPMKPYERYFIEIKNIEELMEFTKKYSRLVLCFTIDEIPLIEIYDDYRE